MTMEQLMGFEPDPRDIAEDAEDLKRPTPRVYRPHPADGLAVLVCVAGAAIMRRFWGWWRS